MRLIDADVLIEEIKRDERILPIYVLSKINAQPTVEEREKGYWVEGKYSYECSICNGGYVGLPKTSYCPFCGAKMEGEE